MWRDLGILPQDGASLGRGPGDAMIFEGRSLRDIRIEDIRLLIANRVREGPQLEYKETAYSGRSEDVREMLRDITAIANADGGYLLMGVREDGSGGAAQLAPVDDPRTLAQSIEQVCLECISERIHGLEIEAYETGPARGVIAVRVPPNSQKPHMMTKDGRTDFYRRYGTQKKPMSIGEIRDIILSGSPFREFVETQVQLRTASSSSESETETETQAAPYAQVITRRPVEKFLERYLVSGVVAQAMVIVSPFITDLSGTPFELAAVVDKVLSDHTRLYIITRKPVEAYHQAAMAVLEKCSLAEIRYNAAIHAKLYLVWTREEADSFGLFGSGNLTEAGLSHNIELGMMIFARGYGRTILRELYQWGSYTLRTMSQRVKAIEGVQ